MERKIFEDFNKNEIKCRLKKLILIQIFQYPLFCYKMFTSAYSPRTSIRPTLSPKTKIQHRSILTPRLPTDIHRATETVSNRKMAGPHESETKIAKRMRLDSATRSYRASDASMQHFLWSRNNISPRQEQTMHESVDVFLQVLKETATGDKYPMVLPRLLSSSEIPHSLTSPACDAAPKISKDVLRAFDEAGYWNCQQKPLTATLPDLYITRQFQEYIYSQHQEMPEVLQQAPVAPPLDPNRNRRPKRNPKLFVDPSTEN